MYYTVNVFKHVHDTKAELGDSGYSIGFDFFVQCQDNLSFGLSCATFGKSINSIWIS